MVFLFKAYANPADKVIRIKCSKGIFDFIKNSTIAHIAREGSQRVDYKELMSKEDYYISFKGFEEVGNREIALRVVLNGSTDETELLVANHDNVNVLHIDFPSYATFSATFEDFTVNNESELYEGHAFRIYGKSDLMDYLRKRTNLESQEKRSHNPYRHFSFVCMEHQIDIVSCGEPTVKEYR